MDTPEPNRTSHTPQKQPQGPQYQWLRWLALPFAAIGGAAAGAFLVTALWWYPQKWLGGWNESGACFEYILPCFSSALFGGFYVAISLMVAPRGKGVAGIVMTTVLCVLSLLGHSWVLAEGDETVGEKVFLSIQLAACLISAIITLVNLYSDPSWTQSPQAQSSAS